MNDAVRFVGMCPKSFGHAAEPSLVELSGTFAKMSWRVTFHTLPSDEMYVVVDIGKEKSKSLLLFEMMSSNDTITDCHVCFGLSEDECVGNMTNSKFHTWKFARSLERHGDDDVSLRTRKLRNTLNGLTECMYDMKKRMQTCRDVLSKLEKNLIIDTRSDSTQSVESQRNSQTPCKDVPVSKVPTKNTSETFDDFDVKVDVESKQEETSAQTCFIIFSPKK